MLFNHRLLIYLNSTVHGDIKKNPMKEQEINKDHILPVQMVRYITMQVVIWSLIDKWL